MDSLTSLHTFSFSAKCTELKTVDSVDSLISIVKALQIGTKQPHFLVLGEGSNTVFVDNIDQIVLLNRIKGILLTEDDNCYRLKVGAGENWHDLVTYCMQKNIGGFENLALIPGTVGATPIQNIGAYGVEIERFVEAVEFLNTHTMQLQSFSHKQCEFGYRDSIFKRQTDNHRVITSVEFVLPKVYTVVTSYGPLKQFVNASANEIFEQVIAIRQSKLPDVKLLGNAGSFYKNPVIDKQHFIQLQKTYADMPFYRVSANQVKIPAAWLIEQLGFKGKQIGNIACFEKQPLVLVNLGGGTGSDLLRLARQIKDKVEACFGITLENEVRLIDKQGMVIL